MSRSSEFRADQQRKNRSKRGHANDFQAQNPSLPLPRKGFEAFISKYPRACLLFKAIYKPDCTDDEIYSKVRTSNFKWTYYKNLIKIINLVSENVIITSAREFLAQYGEKWTFRRCVGKWLAATTHYVMAFVTKHLVLEDMFNYDWAMIMRNVSCDLQGAAVKDDDVILLEFLSRILNNIDCVFDEATLIQEAWECWPGQYSTNYVQKEIPTLFF